MTKLEAFLIRNTGRGEPELGAAAKRIKTLSGVLWTISSGLLWFVVVLIALSQSASTLGRSWRAPASSASPSVLAPNTWYATWSAAFFSCWKIRLRVGESPSSTAPSGWLNRLPFAPSRYATKPESSMFSQWRDHNVGQCNDGLVRLCHRRRGTVQRRHRPGRRYHAAGRGGHAQGTCIRRVIIEPIEVFGVDSFTDTTLTIKARFKTLPSQQYSVGREYRRRLKKAFESEGIELDVTHRVTAKSQKRRPRWKRRTQREGRKLRRKILSNHADHCMT